MCRCHRFRAVSRHAPRTAVTAVALSRAMHRRCHRLCTVPCHAPPLSPPLRRVVPCTAAVAAFALYRAMHRRCRHLCAVSKRPMLRKCDVRIEPDGSVSEASAGVRGSSDITPSFVVCVAVAQPKNMWWLESADVTCCNPPPGAVECDLVTSLRLFWAISELTGVKLKENGPAFPMDDGAPLSRTFMVERTEVLLKLAGVQVVDQAGKVAPVRAASWRAGGVRSALDAGVPVPVIMMLGRWRSLAWENYYMQTKEDIRAAQLAMWRFSSTTTPLKVGDLVPNSVFASIDDTLPQR